MTAVRDYIFFLLKFIKTAFLFYQIYCMQFNQDTSSNISNKCLWFCLTIISNYYSVTKWEAKKKKKKTGLELIISEFTLRNQIWTKCTHLYKLFSNTNSAVCSELENNWVCLRQKQKSEMQMWMADKYASKSTNSTFDMYFGLYKYKTC